MENSFFIDIIENYEIFRKIFFILNLAIYINFFAHIEVKPFHITKMNSFYNIKKYNSILGAIKEYKKNN